MPIGIWMLVAWGGSVVTMLVLLKVWLGRICDLSCEDLSCITDPVCERRQPESQG